MKRMLYIVLAVILAIGGVVGSMSAYPKQVLAAATLTVTTNLDAGDDFTFGVDLAADTADGTGLSLREAIHWASAGDTITFNGGLSGQTVTLSGTHLTIDKDITLDGDLDNDGTPDITISGNSTSRVIYTSGLTAAARLEGFTITNGSATKGGGMYNSGSSPTIVNCTFSNNTAVGTIAVDWGGGMYNNGTSSPTVTGCTFNGNTADYGGGIFNDNSPSPTITDCTFSNNIVSYEGGGICNNVSSGTITDCVFNGNTASDEGGGIYNAGSTPTVTGCTFNGNTADYGGGMGNAGSAPTVTNCTFSSNTADYGGGIYNRASSSPTITDCTFSSNTATSRGGGMYNTSSSPAITNCNYSGNTALTRGGGIYNTNSSSPTITNCTLSGNTASLDGGGMYNSESTLTITGCTFNLNTADGGNTNDALGGGMYNYKSTLIITSCTFLDNAATATGIWISLGGGISNIDSSLTITNCTFSGNTADVGGGMYNDSSSPTITNCTLSGNTASLDGGGIYNGNASSPTVTNCILWGDTGGEIYNDTSPPVPSPVVSYCDVQGGYGTGNINQDPLFVDAAGGDFHLRPFSPCIDAGSNAAVPGGVTEDFEGDARIIDGDGDGNAVVDMGVDETTYPAIDSFTPTSAGIGESVTITGTNFTGATAVKFGGTAASSFNVDSDTQITAVVGSGSSGRVTVITSSGVATSANDFTWVPTGGYAYFEDSGQSVGSSNSFGVALGDVDGDGDLDAFVANYSNQNNKVWLNDSSGTFTDSGQSLGSSLSCGIALGDVDGDGDLDAFVANYGQADTVWLNNGSGTFTDSGQSLGISLSLGIALGDVDGDGDLDAFVANFSGQANKLWLNNGSGTFTDSGQSLGSSDSFGVALGDVDGDGDFDAFVANNTGQANKLWLNNGSGTFTDSGQSLGSSCSYGVALGDVSGDGDLDAFVANFFGQANKVWLNNSSGTFTDSGQSLGPSDSRGVVLGDVDGDGDIDAFVANDTGQANKVWLNNGSGTFTDSGQSLGSSESYGVALGDLDGDGDFDAFVANDHTANKVWLNVVPPPTITSFTPTSAGTGASVNITGSNFTGATAVKFGGTDAASFTVDLDTQITAVVGSGSSGNITVTTPGGTATSTDNFTYIPPPTITSFTPTSAGTGTSVNITGTYFTGATAVKFGGTDAASFTVDSATQITAVVGSGSSGNVTVTTPGGTATKSGFTYIPPPTITSVNPESAYLGYTVSVIIMGTQLTGATTVSFGSGITTNSFTVDSSTQITAVIAISGGAAPGNRDVSVTNLGGTATLVDGFQVLQVIYYYEEPDYYLQMNLLGTSQSVVTSYSGIVEQTVEITSTDGLLTVTIPKGTVARQENGNRLTTFGVSVNENPPLPPENKNIIGLIYNFEPDGATFDPPITLTFTYDPETLPEGVEEEDLVLAFYDEDTGSWIELECVVDTDNHTITALVSHFTNFAIIGKVIPPAAFTVSNLTVEPEQIAPGEVVIITVSVANTGGMEGSYTAILEINEAREKTQAITLAAGNTLEATFTISRGEPGDYVVKVGALEGSFTVTAPPAPPETPVEKAPQQPELPAEQPAPAEEGGINWYIVGTLLGVAILLAILLPIWIRRRTS